MICFNCYSLMDEIKNTEAKLVMKYYHCKNCCSYSISPNPKFAQTLDKIKLEVKENPTFKHNDKGK